MKHVVMLIAALAVARTAAGQNPDDYRGGWRTDHGEAHTYEFSRALGFKGIGHHLDDWGSLGGHDWPYWKHMMREYLKGI